ncbi:MAG: hypothetical protein WCO56_00120 [Verrucomicrobiota bacterium]
MSINAESLNPAGSAERLDRIEARLARIEAQLQLAARRDDNPATATPVADARVALPAPEPSGSREDELEFALGQTWFARAGILVLALGAGFALSLPYPGLPSGLPSCLGYALVGGLFLVAHLWQKSFELVSRYFRSAAMVLLFFATLRLFFFTPTPALSITTLTGKSLLLVVAGINLTIALRRKSPWLTALALGMGYATSLILNSAWFLFPVLVGLSVLVVYAWAQHRWSVILLAGMGATYLTYLLWAMNNPLRGNELRIVGEPLSSVFCLLLCGVIFAFPSFFSQAQEDKEYLLSSHALFNASACFGLFLLHTVLAFDSVLVFAHLVASVVFVGVAAALWMVRSNRIACAFYAITGYMAMSVAILKAFPVPDIFIWLSAQSLVVVATALWFRSPFIVVANFFIYVAIVLGYMFVAKRETGISIGFGLVALVSARILNWQQERLQLRTETMRNAYLVVVFVVFPYASHHLVPRSLVAISWVALAGLYYLLCRVLHNQKYRWMGHFTLLLTVFHVLMLGTTQFKPEYRILSYLVLGTVLVVISLTFSRRRTREQAKGVGENHVE